MLPRAIVDRPNYHDSVIFCSQSLVDTPQPESKGKPFARIDTNFGKNRLCFRLMRKLPTHVIVSRDRCAARGGLSMLVTRMAVGVLVIALLGVGVAAAKAGSQPAASIELARGLIEAEQFEQAVAVLKQLDTQDGATMAQIDNLFGRIYLAIGKPAKALGFFEEASFSSLDDEAEAYLGLAEANLALGNLRQARTNANLSLRTDPDLIAAHLVLAMADQRVGRGAEALARLHKLQQQRPDDVEVTIILSRYTASQDGLAKGVAELQKFVDRIPTAAAAQDALGQMLWAQGRKKDAVMARILAKELYEAHNQSGRAAAMDAWLKAVDPKGEYEKTLKAPVTPKVPKVEESAKAPPQANPPTEAVLTPPVRREPNDEPPPPAPAPRPAVKAMPLAILSHPEPLPFVPGTPIMTGSGIVLEGGRLIVTNRHIIDGRNQIAVRNGTGHVRMARVVKVSPDDDLALLEIDKPFPEGAVMPLDDITEPATGRAAIVMGFPMISVFGDEQPALTEGIVAKTNGLADDPNTFQMTAKLNKGNSGGPVFDKRGHLLGVAVGKADAAGIYQQSGTLIEDINLGIKGGRILRFLGKNPPAETTMPEMSLEDLYQRMLPRAVLIAAKK